MAHVAVRKCYHVTYIDRGRCTPTLEKWTREGRSEDLNKESATSILAGRSFLKGLVVPCR